MEYLRIEESRPFLKDITCTKAREIMSIAEGKETFHIIDARSKSLFDNGHFMNAKLLDAFQNDFEEQIKHLPKDHTYLVYCTAGVRSRIAVDLMKKSGFQKIYHLKYGILACDLKSGEFIKN